MFRAQFVKTYIAWLRFLSLGALAFVGRAKIYQDLQDAFEIVSRIKIAARNSSTEKSGSI